MSRNLKLIGIKLNSAELSEFVKDEELRKLLSGPAREVYSAIPPSEGNVDAPRADKRYKGDKGRYRKKFIDKEAKALDGRVAIDVGVEDANRKFFRSMTLLKAIRSTGAKQRRKRRGKK